MRKETIAKFKEVMEALELKTLFLQGDNTNFYYDGNIEGNCVIFDDTNEIAWGVRVNDNFPNSRFRITAFDYDTIQYLVMEATPEKVKQFLELIKADVPSIDADALAEKFKASKYDKGFKYIK